MASHSSQRYILVAGGAGFIGSHLCERLLAEGRQVICLDNLYTGCEDNSSTTMVSSGYSYIQHGHVAIGKCSIELPKYGKVKVVLNVIIEMGNLAGHYFGSRSITIYQN